MNVKLLTEHHLDFLSLKGGCTGLSESTPVKKPHCRKSYVAAQLYTWYFKNFIKEKEEEDRENDDHTDHCGPSFYTSSHVFYCLTWANREGEQGVRTPPLKNHKNMGFPSNIYPDPLKITKLLSQHSMVDHYRHFSGISILSIPSTKKTNKKSCQCWTPLTKPSESAMSQGLQIRVHYENIVFLFRNQKYVLVLK